MTQNILFSMCNQGRHGKGRTHCLGLLDVDRGSVRWLRSGTTRRDFGITGIAIDEYGLYAAVQAHPDRIRIIQYHPRTLDILSQFQLRHTVDPHSLCLHAGSLLLASTGNNAIFNLRRDNGQIVSEELFWQYPNTSDQQNDVHLNCLASHDGHLFVTAFGPRDADGRFGTNGHLLNVTTGQTCISHLYQPHTILFQDGHVYCASSGSGEVVIGTQATEGWMDTRVLVRGYTRGLAPWKGGILVGVSAHRKQSRSKGNAVALPDNYFKNSQIVFVTNAGLVGEVVLHATNFGAEIYEMIPFELPGRMAPPSPLFSSRLETIRANLMQGRWENSGV